MPEVDYNKLSKLDELNHNAETHIARVLESEFPTVTIGGEGAAKGIPGDAVETIAEYLQEFIGQIIQAWIDAGSELDVTMENEELRTAITNELLGWSERWEEVAS